MKNTFCIKRGSEIVHLDYIYKARKYMNTIEKLLEKSSEIQNTINQTERSTNDIRTICRHGNC